MVNMKYILIGLLAFLAVMSLVYADIYVNDIKFDGDNATGGNLFINADIFLHTDMAQAVGGAGTWYNVTFTHNGDYKHNIDHTYNDDTNDTITIIYDGIYDVKYAANFNNTNANPDDYAVIRLIVNGVEHNSSGMGSGKITKQNAHVPVSGCTRINLSTGDEVKMQFTSTSTDTNIELQSNLYLEHYDSARICLSRIR